MCHSGDGGIIQDPGGELIEQANGIIEESLNEAIYNVWRGVKKPEMLGKTPGLAIVGT